MEQKPAMQESRCHSFRRELFFWLIGLLTFVWCIIEVTNGFMLRSLMQQQYDIQLAAARNSALQAIEQQDQAIFLLEKHLENRLSNALIGFQKAYSTSGGQINNLNLQALRDQWGEDVDFFIIDANDKIIRSTFSPDIGLNLRERPATIQFLESVRQQDGILSEHIALSTNDGIKKFAYQATPDKKYILETGITLSQQMDPGLYPSSLQNINSDCILIEKVRIYDMNGRSLLMNKQGQHSSLSGQRLEAAKQALETGKSHTVMKNRRLFEYSLIPPKSTATTPSQGRIIEVVVNKENWQNTWYRHIILHGFLGLVAIALGIAGSIILARRIAHPLMHLSTHIQQIASGHLDTPLIISSSNREITVLANSTEVMRKKLSAALHYLTAANNELTTAYDTTIRAFYKALEHREPATASHSFDVHRISMEIGRQMNLSDKMLQHLSWGTLLHDIGKLAVPDDILLKPDKLTPEEYTLIQRHPLVGYEVLKGNHYLRHTAAIALFHHERYDGKGYPYGLAGEDIPLLARICSIADAYQAIISTRPYREGRSMAAAKEEIARCSGTQFDPKIVAVFLTLPSEVLNAISNTTMQ